ncbi:MAG: PaaI family thioesterase [Pseudomonadota bacterium]
MTTNPRFVDRLEELPDRSVIASMSGLAFLQSIADGTLPGPPIARVLGYSLESVEAGQVVFRATPLFDAMNPIGSIHGGWYGTLLDSCMSCAVQSRLPKGSGYTTLEYKVSLLRPMVPDGTEVRAIGTTIHVGRRTGTAEGRIVGVNDGKTYATGTATCLVMDIGS